MKLIFAHDHYFYHCENEVYSPGKLPYSAFSRYLAHFSEMIVLSRYQNKSNVLPFWTMSSGVGVTFKKIENISSLRSIVFPSGDNIENIKESLKECNGVIVRLPSEIGLITAKLAREMNIPYVVEVVACPWDAMLGYGSIKSLIYAPLLFLRVRRAVSEAWGALYVTDNFLQRRYPNRKYFAAASDVELPEIDPDILLRRLKKIRNRDSRNFNIGLIASLDSPHKGFDTLYKAMRKLKDKGYCVSLSIVGGGEKFKNIRLLKKLLLDEQVIFLGPKTSGSEIFYFLDNIDLYVQPSNQEGLPRAVIEAMSRACPVITSSVGGMPELCKQEHLHKANDYSGLANKIEKVLNDNNLMIDMAKYSFQSVQRFQYSSLSKIRSNFFKKYKEELSSR
jgi:glycosyltransferase involved in cell wall biosynthesis